MVINNKLINLQGIMNEGWCQQTIYSSGRDVSIHALRKILTSTVQKI
jgi:hypothetical protein